MFDCYLIWGNPRDFDHRKVFFRKLAREAVSITENGRIVSLEVGPVPVSGPVIHSEPAGVNPLEASAISVLVDTDIPSWVEQNFMAALGWEMIERPPSPVRYPFQVDLLLLGPNWTGSFDGWSSTQWFDSSVRPLQRIEISLFADPTSPKTRVHVLDVGTDVHGIAYAVVYCPDRDVIDAAQITQNGWRREPVARLRRQAWLELADLSAQIEVTAVPVFGSAVVDQVSLLVDPSQINGDALNHLPDDVFEAVRESLEQAQKSDAPTGE